MFSRLIWIGGLPLLAGVWVAAKAKAVDYLLRGRVSKENLLRSFFHHAKLRI